MEEEKEEEEEEEEVEEEEEEEKKRCNVCVPLLSWCLLSISSLVWW